MDLQTRLNLELTLACLSGDHNSVINLINAGADPIYNNCKPLQDAVLGGSYHVVNMLLLNDSYMYSKPEQLAECKLARNLALKRYEVTKDPTLSDIANFIRDHIKHCEVSVAPYVPPSVGEATQNGDMQNKEAQKVTPLSDEPIYKLTIFTTRDQWNKLSAITAEDAAAAASLDDPTRAPWLYVLHEHDKGHELAQHLAKLPRFDEPLETARVPLPFGAKRTTEKEKEKEKDALKDPSSVKSETQHCEGTSHTFTHLTKEQRVAKIASDIKGYEKAPQTQLSLFQDLIIELLPHIEHGSPEYLRLMGVCRHTAAENVNLWLSKLMSEYIELAPVKETLSSMSQDDLHAPLDGGLRPLTAQKTRMVGALNG